MAVADKAFQKVALFMRIQAKRCIKDTKDMSLSFFFISHTIMFSEMLTT